MFRCGFQFLSVSFCSCLLVLSLRSLRSLRSLARCACPTVMWFLGACRWCFPVCLCYRCTCQTVTLFLGAYFLTPNPSKILPKSLQNPTSKSSPKTSKILPKNLQNPFRKVRVFVIILKGVLGRIFVPIVLRLGASWRPSWEPLGASWGRLGASWGCFGASLARLGGILGCLGCVLEGPGRVLGASWRVLGAYSFFEPIFQ